MQICQKMASEGFQKLRTPTPPVAEMGGVKEASKKEQCERQQSNATIERAGLTGKPFGRIRRREILYLA